MQIQSRSPNPHFLPHSANNPNTTACIYRALLTKGKLARTSGQQDCLEPVRGFWLDLQEFTHQTLQRLQLSGLDHSVKLIPRSREGSEVTQAFGTTRQGHALDCQPAPRASRPPKSSTPLQGWTGHTKVLPSQHSHRAGAGQGWYLGRDLFRAD